MATVTPVTETTGFTITLTTREADVIYNLLTRNADTGIRAANEDWIYDLLASLVGA